MDKPKAIMCDLDGTLALMGERGPFEMEKCEHDMLNRPVYLMLEACRLAGYRIILVSGRFEGVRDMTVDRSEEHTSELQSHSDLVCRLLLEKKTTQIYERDYRV